MNEELDTAGLAASPEAQARGAREEQYSRLLAQYRAGQMSEAEWASHLLDEDLNIWYEELRR